MIWNTFKSTLKKTKQIFCNLHYKKKSRAHQGHIYLIKNTVKQ